VKYIPNNNTLVQYAPLASTSFLPRLSTVSIIFWSGGEARSSSDRIRLRANKVAGEAVLLVCVVVGVLKDTLETLGAGS
jgi:hypothetical protein